MRKLFFLLLLALAIPGQARAYEQPELDALLAPIALYPDELVEHILVAAAYPDQVGEAARGTPAQPHWHPSVVALAPYPELLQRMAESPQWMYDLSQAYIYQQASVMVTVQSLRSRAAAYGHLPPAPAQQVVYVRYYDPYVVYGPWWWPAYRPVFWHPWHTHRVFIHRAAPVRRHVHVAPRPVRVAPSIGHVKPYQRVPEAQRRPIINSTPQLRAAPAQVRSAPAQVRSAPAQVRSAPAQVRSNPAPIRHAQAPVQQQARGFSGARSNGNGHWKQRQAR